MSAQPMTRDDIHDLLRAANPESAILHHLTADDLVKVASDVYYAPRLGYPGMPIDPESRHGKALEKGWAPMQRHLARHFRASMRQDRKTLYLCIDGEEHRLI